MGAMMIPTRLVAIAQAMRLRFPDLAKGTDDQRRALTTMIAQQAAFELGPQWGTKASSRTNPASKDAIAFLSATGTLWGWDSLNGTTREVSDSLEMEDITGQFFIPVVPQDLLGQTGETPGRSTPVEPPAPVLGAVEDALRAFRAEVRSDLERLKQQTAEDHGTLAAQADRIYVDLCNRLQVPVTVIAPTPVPPVYEGSVTIFGRTLTFVLTPRA